MLSQRNGSSERFDNWNAIADFLGRSVRTAQRWHSHGMPVYKTGKNNSTIFAFSDELLSWIKRCETSEDGSILARKAILDDADLKCLSEYLAHDVDVLAVNCGAKATAQSLAKRACSLWPLLSSRNISEIARLFREATDIDPESALAYAGFAQALILQAILGLVRPSEAYSSASAAVDFALHLDPDLDEVRCAEAWLKLVLEHDWNRARRAFNHLIQMGNPSSRTLTGIGLIHIGAGRIREGAEVLGQASLQDPLNSEWPALRCWTDYLAHDYVQAKEQILHQRQCGNHECILAGVDALVTLTSEAPASAILKIKESIEISPECPLLWGALGHAFAQDGDVQQARSILSELEHRPTYSQRNPYYAISLIRIALREYPQAVYALQQAYKFGSIWSFGFHSDPILQPLQGVPAFCEFLQLIYAVDPFREGDIVRMA